MLNKISTAVAATEAITATLKIKKARIYEKSVKNINFLHVSRDEN